MTRFAVAFAVLSLTFVLSRPAAAQDAAGGDDKFVGGGPGVKCGGAGAANDIRVQFDKEDAKGELKCKKGKLLGGKIKYPKCVHDKFDDYGEVAWKKKIIKKKPGQLDEKKLKLAKKLAFFGSARAALKDKLGGLKDKPEDLEYKKTEGALEKVDQEYDKALAECSKQDAAEFTCPAKD